MRPVALEVVGEQHERRIVRQPDRGDARPHRLDREHDPAAEDVLEGREIARDVAAGHVEEVEPVERSRRAGRSSSFTAASALGTVSSGVTGDATPLDPSLVDEERGPDDPVVRVTAVVLLAPGTERVRDGMILVGEQRRRATSRRTPSAASPAVGADAHDVQPDPAEVLPVVPQVARLDGAAGRVRLGIEVDEELPPR